MARGSLKSWFFLNVLPVSVAILSSDWRYKQKDLVKKILSLLLVFTFCGVLRSQDSIRRYEFGSTLLTFNNGNIYKGRYVFPHEKNPLEILNGLFFRYSFTRFG